MAIVLTLDVMLARRKMTLKGLSMAIGLSEQNLSMIKTGKVKGVRFDTLDRLCVALGCRPGDLIDHVPDDPSG
ncbi:MAG: helix-turn-helix transcriptional regulator [Pseudomonadota bacterium]|uniref:helix-turn-helix domain-containing protein n=1 Tax=Sphingomonas sp. ERG5 TaxID=1381597 RepID=UPI00054C063D|nr:helix-turn-helix transcriptional regulator [Sphingomonas sp. ERG5]